MEIMTVVYFAGSLFFALISFPLIIVDCKEGNIKGFVGDLDLVAFSFLFLFLGLRGV